MSIELMIASNHLILCHCVNFYNKWWLSWTRDRLVRGLVIISTTKAYPRGSGTKHSEAVCDLNEGKEKEDAFNCVFWLFPASHALESYTALPYHMRSPCPSSPITRPAYQGSNPISDIWAAHALRIVAKYLKRYVVQKGQKQGKKKTSFHLHEMWLARSWNVLSKPVHPKKQSLCIQKYQRPATSGGSPKGTEENQIPRSRKAKPRMGTTWEPDL